MFVLVFLLFFFSGLLYVSIAALKANFSDLSAAPPQPNVEIWLAAGSVITGIFVLCIYGILRSMWRDRKILFGGRGDHHGTKPTP